MIYVWFDALLGYISSTKEWAQKIGQPEKWREYWQDPDTRLIHFIGKDNIVFHCIVFPAMLMAWNEGRSDEIYVLTDNVPANEFLNLEGKKLSTSRNYAVWLNEYLEKFEPDPFAQANFHTFHIDLPLHQVNHILGKSPQHIYPQETFCPFHNTIASSFSPLKFPSCKVPKRIPVPSDGVKGAMFLNNYQNSSQIFQSFPCSCNDIYRRPVEALYLLFPP